MWLLASKAPFAGCWEWLNQNPTVLARVYREGSPFLTRSWQTGNKQVSNKKADMVKAGLLILSGNAATSLLLLARNLLVARLIPVSDYGVAATFAIAMAVVEMASSLGLQQQIVQAKDGDDPKFQAALQGFQVLRGVLAGIVLFALAGPLATFMGVGEVAWAYQILAVVPVLNALQHFDIHRLNRDMVFGPVVLTGAVPALVSLIVVWPLATALGDYRVMLWAIVVQAVLMTVFSHITAQRAYLLVWDAKVMRESLAFGWPLLINGILLFAVFQGDKVIVGRAMGMETLAIFAMGFTLTLTPTLVMAKSAQNFFLPQLRHGNPQAAQRCLQVALLNGVVLVVAVWALGGVLVDLVLGPKFAGLEPLLIGFALVQAVRVAKSGPAVVALASGDTRNAMWGNVVRVISLVPVAWVVSSGGGLHWVIALALLAELLGLVVVYALMMIRVQVMPPMPALVTWLVFGCGAIWLNGGI
jgi:O-antigen/teichoic acid export membrane protein